jgi:hypothetical protein
MTTNETRTGRGTYGQDFEYEAPKRTVGGLLAIIADHRQAAAEDFGDLDGNGFRFLADLADIEEGVHKTYRSLCPTFEDMTAASWEAFLETPSHDARLLAFVSEITDGDHVAELLNEADDDAREDARIDSDNEVEHPRGD